MRRPAGRPRSSAARFATRSQARFAGAAETSPVRSLFTVDHNMLGEFDRNNRRGAGKRRVIASPPASPTRR